MKTTTTDRTALRRPRRGTSLGRLGLLPVAAALLATVAAVPASAGQLAHCAVPARHAARHVCTTGPAMTLAPAPAGLRAAVRAALGQPGTAPGRSAAPTGLVPADHQADFFGVSVAVSGNTALVGATTAHRRTGAAYVFVHGPRGWVQQARLTAADGVALDGFGASVALDGNTALVGASNRGQDGARGIHGTGGAYVFTRTGATWSQQALLIPPVLDRGSGEFFGFSVGLSGTTALIGAPGDGPSQGAAFAFTRTGTTWAQTAKVTGSDSGQGDAFGFALAFSGHTAIVGAPQKGGFTGEAYVFTQSATGFTQQATLAAPHRQTGDLFGRSVAVSGNTALAGAPGVSALTGAAYVFTRTGTHWARQATLTATGGQQNDGLGQDALAIAGNTAVVGADLAATRTGAAYEFVFTGLTWAQKAKFTDPHGAPNDLLGHGVAIAGTTALTGAPGHHHNQGQVGLFHL